MERSRMTMDYHSYTGRKSHLLVSNQKCSRLINSPINFYKRLHTVQTQRAKVPMKSEQRNSSIEEEPQSEISSPAKAVKKQSPKP